MSDNAEFPLQHQVARLDQMRSAAPLRAHLNHAFVLAGRRQHRLPFHHVHADRLLQVQVGAGAGGLDHGQGVPMIRGGDLHHVQVFLLEHLAVVGEHPRLLFGCLARGRHLRAVGHHLPVDVAQRDNLDGRHLDQAKDIGLAIPAAADESHSFGGQIRGFCRIAAGGWQRQRGKTSLNEFTTVHRFLAGSSSGVQFIGFQRWWRGGPQPARAAGLWIDDHHAGFQSSLAICIHKRSVACWGIMKLKP